MANNAKQIIKTMLAQRGMTITAMLEELGKKYPEYESSISNFSNRMSRDTILFSEMEAIADILGYQFQFALSGTDRIISPEETKAISDRQEMREKIRNLSESLAGIQKEIEAIEEEAEKEDEWEVVDFEPTESKIGEKLLETAPAKPGFRGSAYVAPVLGPVMASHIRPIADPEMSDFLSTILDNRKSDNTSAKHYTLNVEVGEDGSFIFTNKETGQKRVCPMKKRPQHANVAAIGKGRRRKKKTPV